MNLDTEKYLQPLQKANNPRVASSWVEAKAAPGWRCVFVHELTEAENQGGHAVYVDCLDITGRKYLPVGNHLKYGWEGMRPEEMPPLSPFEKQAPEPGANVPLFRGQRLWVEIADMAGVSSDRVIGLSAMPEWHKSIYVVFQYIGLDVPPVTPNRKVIVDYDALLDLEVKLKSALLDVQTMRGAK